MQLRASYTIKLRKAYKVEILEPCMPPDLCKRRHAQGWVHLKQLGYQVLGLGISQRESR